MSRWTRLSLGQPPKKFTVPRSAEADDAHPKKAKPTPEGWTDEAWLADCERRKVESEGRRQRAERAQQKKAAVAAKKLAEEAARMKANADGYHAGARSASGLVFPPILGADEARHRESALELGAAELPEPVKRAMRLASRVMTTVAYRV